MNREEIIRSLKGIFSQYFNITEDFREENFDKALTEYFFFDYSNLVYLYILVEKTFHIRIDSRQLTGYRFNTINDITKTIRESILI